MKKMIFYVTNTIICSFFLNVRLLFLLFGDVTKLSDSKLTIVNVLTAVIATVMLVSIVLSYKESKKNDQ